MCLGVKWWGQSGETVFETHEGLFTNDAVPRGRVGKNMIRHCGFQLGWNFVMKFGIIALIETFFNVVCCVLDDYRRAFVCFFNSYF